MTPTRRLRETRLQRVREELLVEVEAAQGRPTDEGATNRHIEESLDLRPEVVTDSISGGSRRGLSRYAANFTPFAACSMIEATGSGFDTYTA
jgi:hypothetical protein